MERDIVSEIKKEIAVNESVWRESYKEYTIAREKYLASIKYADEMLRAQERANNAYNVMESLQETVLRLEGKRADNAPLVSYSAQQNTHI